MGLDISNQSIKALLDNLDIVLNSNTFLLYTKVAYQSLEKTIHGLSLFIKSDNFINQILLQDKERGWDNLEKFSLMEIDKIKFIKENFTLKGEMIADENKVPYLRNMLSIENKNSVFFSPYKKQLSVDIAEKIIQNFIHALAPDQKWKLIKFDTDFSYVRSGKETESFEMHYFEGGYSSDSMTLLVNQNNEGFLLLTNGIA